MDDFNTEFIAVESTGQLLKPPENLKKEGFIFLPALNFRLNLTY